MQFPVLRAERLTARLASTMWDRVDVVASTGSTNLDLAAAARGGARGPRVLIAGEQTAGRGRMARSWESPAGSSVAMSVLLEPEQGWEAWGWLSLLAGCAVSAALEELAPEGVDVALKWPNDVLVDGGKVCGILSERIEHPAGARAVVGMGINLSLRRDELPVPHATSLALAGYTAGAEDVVVAVLEHFERYYNFWERDGTLREAYTARCASIGAELTISIAGEAPKPGVGRGVDDDGRLIVETADGLETFAVGDVVHARLA
ncbi:MAG: biotin--[acetyl-CoA-carboxylase] ligase [Propionibacterium sp.]|nr:biotin--[acetyl-CoA-carboxylase] ligase [Propionibacterium sp.]